MTAVKMAGSESTVADMDRRQIAISLQAIMSALSHIIVPVGLAIPPFVDIRNGGDPARIPSLVGLISGKLI